MSVILSNFIHLILNFLSFLLVHNEEKKIMLSFTQIYLLNPFSISTHPSLTLQPPLQRLACVWSIKGILPFIHYGLAILVSVTLL